MAAANILAAEGPQGLSMRKVAALAECSTMVIYHHFGSKQGLLDAVYVEGFSRLREAQAQAVDVDVDDPGATGPGDTSTTERSRSHIRPSIR